MDPADFELFEWLEAALAQLEEELRWKPWRVPDYERIFHGTWLALRDPRSCRKPPPFAPPAPKPRPLQAGILSISSDAQAPASALPFCTPEAQLFTPLASGSGAHTAIILTLLSNLRPWVTMTVFFFPDTSQTHTQITILSIQKPLKYLSWMKSLTGRTVLFCSSPEGKTQSFFKDC